MLQKSLVNSLEKVARGDKKSLEKVKEVRKWITNLYAVNGMVMMLCRAKINSVFLKSKSENRQKETYLLATGNVTQSLERALTANSHVLKMPLFAGAILI